MTRKSSPSSPGQKKAVLPDLSDESLVQIRNFLHLALDVFEDRYAQQLDLFHHPLWQESQELDSEKFSDCAGFLLNAPAPPDSTLAAFLFAPQPTPSHLLTGVCTTAIIEGCSAIFDLP